jgi:hypothetical protein
MRILHDRFSSIVPNLLAAQCVALIGASIEELTNYSIFQLEAASFVHYLAGLAVYRLLLSSIAGFAAQKLAALAQWYS